MPELANPIRPPRLRLGDTIGLVAPAGPCRDRAGLEKGIAILREMGFRVKFSPAIHEEADYLAGSDQNRAADFNSLWADEEVEAILALRGGYGSIRMLAGLDLALIRHSPKLLIGFSDIGVLLTALLKQCGLVTFHGPMAATLASSDQESRLAFFEMLTGEKPAAIAPAELEILSPGQASGVLLGGNLTTLVHLLATPYEISWRQAIVFLEDVNESAYRIDRLLTHLQEAGRLNEVAGIILGGFSPQPVAKGGDTRLIWRRVLELTGGKIPVWGNFPAGHGPANRILPLGVRVTMDSERGQLQFLEAATRDSRPAIPPGAPPPPIATGGPAPASA